MSCNDSVQSKDMSANQKQGVIKKLEKNVIEHKEEEEDEKSEEIMQQEIDEEELFQSVMSKEQISAILSSKGPTVKAVVLKTDGTAIEIDYDSTPSRNHVTQILKAPPSIIGQWADLDVILVCPRCSDEDEMNAFGVNQHKLRFPFNNDTFYGDIFLYKFNQQCEVVNFTLNEYQQFAAKIDEDEGKIWQSINDENNQNEDEEEDDYEQEEEDDIDDEEAMKMQFEFLQNTVINKVKKEFPEKFGREPTEEELESYIAASMQSFAALFGGNIPEGDEQDEEEEEDDDDEEYDPSDDKHQAIMDQVEDVTNPETLENDKKDIEKLEKENEEPMKEINDEEFEEKLVNDNEFEKELNDAIKCVQDVAKFDKQLIIERARKQYKLDTGNEPTNDMLANAFSLFSIDQHFEQTIDDNNDQDDEQKVDAEYFAKELNDAINNVTNLGEQHGKELINSICNRYENENGTKPTNEEIKDIFDEIKKKFADEAQQEFLERNDDDVEDEDKPITNQQLEELKNTLLVDTVDNDQDDEDEVEDEEYELNANDIKQMEEDKRLDLMAQIEEKQEIKQESVVKVKVLTTPIKKAASGSRMDIYLQNPEQDGNKTLNFAASKFEEINKKAPNDDDKKRLKDFLKTGMLFESQYQTKKYVDNDNQNDDDEDDSDYNPDKDSFDYSKDDEDDDFLKNDDYAEMIDVD